MGSFFGLSAIKPTAGRGLWDVFITDPIPVVDELIMTVMFFDKVRKVAKTSAFIKKHKMLITIVAIAVVALLGFVLYIIMTE